MNKPTTAVTNQTEEVPTINFTAEDISLIGFTCIGGKHHELRAAPLTMVGLVQLELLTPIVVAGSDFLAFYVNDHEQLILRHKKTGENFAIEACLDHFLFHLKGNTMKAKNNRFHLDDRTINTYHPLGSQQITMLEQRCIAETRLVQFSVNDWGQLVVRHKLTEEVFTIGADKAQILIALRGGSKLRVRRNEFEIIHPN
jgi:hypothetical protein